MIKSNEAEMRAAEDDLDEYIDIGDLITDIIEEDGGVQKIPFPNVSSVNDKDAEPIDAGSSSSSGNDEEGEGQVIREKVGNEEEGEGQLREEVGSESEDDSSADGSSSGDDRNEGDESDGDDGNEGDESDGDDGKGGDESAGKGYSSGEDTDDPDYVEPANEVPNFENADDDYFFVEEDGVDDATREKGNLPKFDRAAPNLEVGMIFEDASDFKEAVSLYALKIRRSIVWSRNEKEIVSAKCLDRNCNWSVYASISNMLGSFQIKKYFKEHHCNMVYKNNRMTSKILSELYKETLITHPNTTIAELQSYALGDWGVHVSTSMARRAKKRVVERNIANYKQEFSRIWDYADVLQQTNPRSSVGVVVSEPNDSGQPFFQRMYVCLDALKRGLLF